MSAASFDVHTYRRPGMPIPRTALTTIWARDLDRRESALAEREARVARRERELESVERIHELRQLGSPDVSAPIRSERVATPRSQQSGKRFTQTFSLTEVEWWKKQLGNVPVLLK
jgi:hypothetical protein